MGVHPLQEFPAGSSRCPLEAVFFPKLTPRERIPLPREPRVPRPVGRPRDTLFEAMAKSAVRSIGSQVGRQVVRGVLGSILGGGRR
jgi:hypothetical protein